MNHTYMIIVIAMLSLMTFVTRAVPFVFSKQLRENALLQSLGQYLPMSILFILVLHGLEHTNFKLAPFGAIELGSLGVVVLLHWVKRNAVISTFVGTAVYMLLKSI